MNDELRVRVGQLTERMAELAGDVADLVRDAYAEGYQAGLSATKQQHDPAPPPPYHPGTL